jgi:hypothetical protein
MMLVSASMGLLIWNDEVFKDEITIPSSNAPPEFAVARYYGVLGWVQLVSAFVVVLSAVALFAFSIPSRARRPHEVATVDKLRNASVG